MSSRSPTTSICARSNPAYENTQPSCQIEHVTRPTIDAATHLQIVEVDDLVEGDNGHLCSCWQTGLARTTGRTVFPGLILLLGRFVVLVFPLAAVLLCAIDNLLERPAHLLQHRVRVQLPVLRIVAGLLASALRRVARDIDCEDVVERLRGSRSGESRARSERRRVLHPVILWHDEVYRPSQQFWPLL